MPFRLLITGQAGHGKDTIGNHLIEHYGFLRLSFIDPMKIEVCERYEAAPVTITPDYLNARETKNIPQEALALGYCSDQNFVGIALKCFEQEDNDLFHLLNASSTDSNAAAGIAANDEHLRELILSNVRRTHSNGNALKDSEIEVLAAGGFIAAKLGWLETVRNRISGFTLADRLALPRSSRRITQTFGTDYRRLSEFGKDTYWTDKIDMQVKENEERSIVITDGRTEPELDLGIRHEFQRIHVVDPRKKEAVGQHSTEIIRAPDEKTIIIKNDSSLQNLYTRVDEEMCKVIANAQPARRLKMTM